MRTVVRFRDGTEQRETWPYTSLAAALSDAVALAEDSRGGEPHDGAWAYPS